MVTTRAPVASHKPTTRFTASGSDRLRRRHDHGGAVEEVGARDARSRCAPSPPWGGCPRRRTGRRPREALGRRDDAPLGAADVGDDGAAARPRSHTAGEQAVVGEHRGGEHERSASRTPSARSVVTASSVPSCSAGASRSRSRPDRHDLAGEAPRPRRPGHRAAQEPEPDDRQPSDHAGFASEDRLERLDEAAVLLRGADGHAQRATPSRSEVMGRTMTPCRSSFW